MHPWEETDESASIDPGFDMEAPQGDIDPGFIAGPAQQGILDGLSAPSTSSGLHMLMEPQDIATIPGLPAHVYQDAGVKSPGDYALSVATPVRASTRQPPGYVSPLDHVSLAQPDWNSSGLNFSQSGSVPKATDTGDKLESAGTGANILGHGIDLWNAQNALVGIPLGQEGARLLGGYTGPVAEALGPIGEGIKGYSEWKNGAPIVPTATGTAANAITGWTGARIGALGGGEIGGFFGQPEVGAVVGGAIGGFAPEFAYRHMSQQQIGNAMARAYGQVADAYGRTVSVDPRSVLP